LGIAAIVSRSLSVESLPESPAGAQPKKKTVKRRAETQPMGQNLGRDFIDKIN